MKKEGLMQKKPILYCTIVLAVIAVVCGAALGLGNMYLKTPKDNSGDLGIIFNALTGTKEYAVVFNEETEDTFKVGNENITITKTARDAAKIGAAYRIENEGKIYLLIKSYGTARNASSEPNKLVVITAYIVGGGDAKSDKIAGMRPLDAPASEYRNAYNKTFAGSFSDKSAGTPVKLSDTDGYTGATVTATGLVEAVNNASDFYVKYRGSLLGQADSPFIKALKAAYKFAALANDTAFTGMPSNVKLKMTDDGLPVFDVDCGDYNAVVSFADKDGYIGGAALYDSDSFIEEGALAEAAAKIAGNAAIKDTKQAFANSLTAGVTGDTAAVEAMAGAIHDAYVYFDANRQGILEKNVTFNAALKAGLDKITQSARVNGTADGNYTPVLGLSSGGASLNTVLYSGAYYYSAYRLTGGDYIMVTTANGYDGSILAMTYITAGGLIKEFMLYKDTAEIGYPYYIDGNKFLKPAYNGALVQITATNFQKTEDAMTGDVAIDITEGTVATSYKAIANCIVKAANLYRAVTA